MSSPKRILVVTAAEGSDAWRHTSYGFVHDDQHALLAPLEPGTAVEVEFRADLASQFDQAGVYVRVDEENWIKAGVEFVDGVAQLGCGDLGEVGLVRGTCSRMGG